VVNGKEENLDLLEAAAVLVAHKTGTPVTPDDLSRSLGRYLQEIRAQLKPNADPGDKIDGLNRVLIPALRSGRETEFRGLFEAFGLEAGGCTYSCLLYWIAADTLGVPVEPIFIPRHVFLCHRSPRGTRFIETTSKGESLTIEEYRKRQLTGDITRSETLPEDEGALASYLRPATRRQFVASMICFGDGRKATSTDSYDDAIRAAPDFYYPLKLLGGYYAVHRDYEKAEATLSKAIALAPYVPGLFGSRGSGRFLEAKFAGAMEDLDAALHLAPNYAQFHLLKAFILEKQGRTQEAVASCKRAVECFPTGSEFWKFHSALLKKLKKYEEAIQSATKAIEYGPDHAEYYQQRAELWAMVGDESKYDADLRKARELTGRN
jgi:Tfp pilus assembly protein PilF